MNVLMMMIDLCMIAQSLTTAMRAMQQLNSLSDCLLTTPILTTKTTLPFVMLLTTVVQSVNQKKITPVLLTVRKQVLINEATVYVAVTELIVTIPLDIAISCIPKTRFAATKYLSIKDQEICLKFVVLLAPLIRVSKMKIQAYQIVYLI